MRTALFFVMMFGNLTGALVARRANERGNVVRSVLALAFAGVTVAAPSQLSREWPLFQTVIAFATAAGALRVVQIVRDPRRWDPAARAITVIIPIFDGRLHHARVPRTFRIGAFIGGVIETSIAWMLFEYVLRWPPVAPYSGMPSVMRTLVGGTSAYLVVDGSARLIVVMCTLLGFDFGPLHDAPIRSRTVAEFWSRRWNRAIHAWFDENAFRPIAKRAGVLTGVMASFGTSALLHLVPVWIICGCTQAMWMGIFFVAHGAIVIIESKLRVSRWPPVLGHVWTLAIFALTAPLFVESLLEALRH